MRTLTLLIVTLVPLALHAQSASEKPVREIGIREVEIYGQRPMKETGIQQTRIDSAVLHENVALSMADVLTFNSSIFVKSYGRATLSTVAFRGTSPSHTQVTWNGMRINSPMLGMTDFSMIPAYFIDDAALLHGTSSVNETGGGLGGAVKLSTTPTKERGIGLQYVQGVGSFRTFDEFLRLTYSSDSWQSSTRVVVSTSANDYKYRNRDKKENIYDDDRNIVGSYYPVERNRSGAFRDVHALQEIYYNTGRGDRFGLNVWYLDSERELPVLTVDYGDEKAFENKQRENTLRSVLSWEHLRQQFRVGAKAGYIHTWMGYNYSADKGNGTLSPMIRSRNTINTLYGQVEAEYSPSSKWLLTASLTAHQQFVRSIDRAVRLAESLPGDGREAVIGYDKARIELSTLVSAKWRPTERLGLALTLREELAGTTWAPLIPAFFADYLISKRGNLLAKASVSRNHRFPTLNDLYFKPGGNPDLRPESGVSYDAGLSFGIGRKGRYSLTGSAAWFDSRIDDWIIWLHTSQGFFSPRNIKRVHAYGVELKADLDAALSKEWQLGLGSNYSWTPSINEGEPISPADRSVGKQLVYVPEHSASLTGRLGFRTWSLLYKWAWYSERYTMSSNDIDISGYLPPYFMSNLTLEKGFSLRWADLSLKGVVNNLFNEEYLSVLARPMPGINFEFFIGIKPKWGRR